MSTWSLFPYLVFRLHNIKFEWFETTQNNLQGGYSYGSVRLLTFYRSENLLFQSHRLHTSAGKTFISLLFLSFFRSNNFKWVFFLLLICCCYWKELYWAKLQQKVRVRKLERMQNNGVQPPTICKSNELFSLALLQFFSLLFGLFVCASLFFYFFIYWHFAV